MLGTPIADGDPPCQGLVDLLEGLAVLPEGLASDDSQDDAATGGAGTPTPDETIKELTDLLGVKP